MNKLLTNFPVTLTEEQKNVLKLTLSAVLQDDPVKKYWRPTVYENGDITWSLVASESDPLSQNIKGPSGFTPQFQIDQSTAEWQVTYDGTNWTPLGIIASGAQGPQGASGTPGKDGTNGTNGTDGTSIYLKSVTDAQGGKQVTLGWGTSDTSAFVIPSGAAGTPGTDGVSPTVTTSEIGPTTEHPQGGTSVTITDKTGPNQFNVWNGINGQGATVNLLGGTGIKITENGINYTIGVSADYVLKSELPDLTPYATKTYANEASANALSAAANWVGQQGYLKAVPAGYATETYADAASAEALSQAKTWVNQKNFATSAGLDANKQYAMTTNGWSDFTIPSVPDITPSNGLSANGHTVGISNAGIDADTQYAWTTSGWKPVQGGGGGGETNIIESIRLEGDSADVTITNKKATIPLANASAAGVAGNTGVITKDDKAHLDAAVEYKENPYDSSSPKALVPQQMFVCESDQQIIDIVTNHTDLINGKGTIFFRITGI